MRHLKRFFILVILGLMAISASAAQPIPAAPWYAVLWVRGGDRLYWVNQNGLQASLQRPLLPDEKITGSNPRIRISPNGRYMVMAAVLNNGFERLGIYDILNGNFLQTHTAQAGETIDLGGSAPFTQDGRFMAIGFSAGSAWRVITFEMQTGASVAVLNNGDANAPNPGGQVTPRVVYYNLNLDLEQDLEQVHFLLLPPGAGGGNTYPAYNWSPLSGQVSDSPYKYSTMDVLPQTGAIARSGSGDNSPNTAVIESPGQGTQVVATAGSSVTTTRWAKGGEWLLFQTTTWNITEPASNNQFNVPSNILNAYGTPNGYIFTDDQLRVLFTNGFTTNTAPVIWQAPGAFEVTYITPMGSPFALASIGDPPAVVQPTAFPVGIGPQCGSSLPARLLPNMTARVTFTDGKSLRVRQTPAGIIMTYLPEGTVFRVLEGPQCLNFYNWWRVQLADSSIGWAAEASVESYFIEPWNLTSPQPNGTPITVFVLPSPTPPGAGISLIPDGNCNLAPLQSVAVGDTVLVRVGGTATLSVRQNPTDQFPSAQIDNGQQLSIVEGPQCHLGYRYWRVVTINGSIPGGWVSEGSQVEYFLRK
jgi:hypothetical protein